MYMHMHMHLYLCVSFSLKYNNTLVPIEHGEGDVKLNRRGIPSVWMVMEFDRKLLQLSETTLELLKEKNEPWTSGWSLGGVQCDILGGNGTRCVRVCVHACVCVCVHACVCACMRVCVYVPMMTSHCLVPR